MLSSRTTKESLAAGLDTSLQRLLDELPVSSNAVTLFSLFLDVLPTVFLDCEHQPSPLKKIRKRHLCSCVANCVQPSGTLKLSGM